MMRFPKSAAVVPLLGGSPPITSGEAQYPWADGDVLCAGALNAAVSQSQGWFYPAHTAPGVVLDGVTDSGAAFNAWMQTLPVGAFIVLDGSLYTSVTIVLDQARSIIAAQQGRIAIAGTNHSNWVTGAVNEIIGAPTLSPVVSVQENYSVTHSNGNFMSGIGITRANCTIANGAATLVSGVLTGLIGLQVSVMGFLADHVRVYGHDVGIALVSASIMDELRFCETWDIGTAHYFIQVTPQVTIYDATMELNNSAAGPQSCIWCDDYGGSGAGTTNTVTISRAQFNTGGSYTTYGLRFTNIVAGSSVSPFYVVDCYSDGAATAFVYVDPSCGSFIDFVVGNTHIDMPNAGTLFSDPNHIATHQHWHNNRIAGAPLTFGGGANVVVTDNIFAGAAALSFTNVNGLVCIGNIVGTLTVNACGGVCNGNQGSGTLSLQGAMNGLTCTGNQYPTISKSYTGTISGINSDAKQLASVDGGWTWLQGAYLSLLWNGNASTAQLAACSPTTGAIHMGSGAWCIAFDVPVVPHAYLYSALPTATAQALGATAFCSNGRNSGEGTGAGTGCLVVVKPTTPGGASTTYIWAASWSGLAVTT